MYVKNNFISNFFKIIKSDRHLCKQASIKLNKKFTQNSFHNVNVAQKIFLKRAQNNPREKYCYLTIDFIKAV